MRTAIPRLDAKRNQQGVIAVLICVALVAMLGIVGLALDGGHGMLSKSRLQTMVDVAALNAAKVLDLSDGDEDLARNEAINTMNQNAGQPGNEEIAAAGGLNVLVEFSNTLDPFVPGSTPAEYVRVRATNLVLPAWFTTVMGFNNKNVAASAVAGPSPTLNRFCNVVPLMVCGDPEATDGLLGYTQGDVHRLKTTDGGAESEVGPGNFQFIRLGDSVGKADTREALAGGYEGCFSIDDVMETEPGGGVGPAAQGLNTRMGDYSGPMNGTQSEYPPDLVTDPVMGPLTYEDGVIYNDGIALADNPIPWGYEEYLDNMMDENFWAAYEAGGVATRRVLRVPVGDCSTTTNGQGSVPVLGVLCFFMLQEVSHSGSDAEIYGQFMGADDTCQLDGRPGPDPGVSSGPYRIQLYEDPDWDSA